jgi:hypothetical protein
MSKARLAALAGATLLAFAGCGHAAVAPLDGSLTLAPAAGATFNAGAGGGSGESTRYYQLIVDPSWADPADLTAFLAEPVGSAAWYALYADVDASLAASDTGTLLARWSQGTTPASDFPFYSYLLGAGQFVLEVGTFASQPPVSAKVSALPLPGATWLFGSGLLAFLWISARHRL